MKKIFIIIIVILIILQFPHILIYRHYEIHFIEEIESVNLTSLMIPFEHMDKTSTFSCSKETLDVRYQLEYQQLQYFQLGQIYERPNIDLRSKKHYYSSLPSLPYFYSLWKSSSLLPRMMKPCEHQVYIQLLRAFDKLCRRNHIEYMISHGTLLGSYRNHDILPYDDDADILINAKYYSRLAQLSKFKNETKWQIYLKSNRNIKFYFRNSPSAGQYRWNWPFIGIQFFTENLTHIYLHHYIRKEFIYPLVLHPIASLWLPGPRQIHEYIHGLRRQHFIKFSIDEKCMMQAYSHQHEKNQYKQKVINCSQLHNIYPYIRRTCFTNYCYEYFMLNNLTTFYILKIPLDMYSNLSSTKSFV